MIVLAWFILVAFVILVGFTVVGVTLWHWYKQSQQNKRNPTASKIAEV